MCKRIVLALVLLCSGADAAADVKEILAIADGYRLSAASAKVVTRVLLYKDGELSEERLYHVYSKPGRRSLVLMKSAAELGQKVLMLDDKYWLIMPGSKRPIRITASQKLLGEASTGDVATLTWSDDYSGEILGEERIDGVPALKLELRSARAGSTYARIVLWVGAEARQPLQAELYLASGKLAKVASYQLGQLEGRPTVVKTVLQDRIQTNRRTELEVQTIEPAEIADKIYNPAYLLRDNLEEW